MPRLSFLEGRYEGTGESADRSPEWPGYDGEAAGRRRSKKVTDAAAAFDKGPNPSACERGRTAQDDRGIAAWQAKLRSPEFWPR
jgi:hypothetical protein